MLVSAQSVSPDQNHVFHVPLWDIVGQKSSTGGYPWKVEGGVSTVVYIKNVTDRRQQYTWQLRHAAGTYSLGLRTIEPHQTDAIDTRDLRDRQVPDEKGRTIPLAAAAGQIHWSTRGGENLALIGRAEQVDTARGHATSYACQNCCPDSFFDALSDGCFEPLIVEDTTQLFSFQRDRDCYGQIHDSYAVSSIFSWLSFDAGVVSVDGGGFVEGVGAGDTTVQAMWFADRWLYSTFNESCEHSLEQVAANALCSVIAPDVQFLHAKLYSEQKDFLLNRVTLSANASGRGEEICGQGRDFQFTARFKLHEDAVALSEARSSVKVFGEPPNTNHYIIRNWAFTDVNMSAKTGNVVVNLFRRGPRPDPEVIHETIVITIAGDYGFGGFSVPGNVKITCP